MHTKQSQKNIGIKQSRNNSSSKKIRGDSSGAVVSGLLHSNEEIWIPVKGFKGMYEISNLGRVKALKRKAPGFSNLRICYFNEKIIKPYTLQCGYKRIHFRKNKKLRRFLLHRLIAINFIPNPKKLPQINHKNGIKTDNRIKNLEWCTCSQNIIHSFKKLGHKSSHGEEHYYSKLKNYQVRQIKKLKGKMTQRKIGEKYNVSHGAIGSIFRNQTWKHIV